jgi:hypothetical protein
VSAKDELWEIRTMLRATWTAFNTRGFRTPDAQAALDSIDQMCLDLTEQMDRIEPPLPLYLPMRMAGGAAP